jgi:hypothetical protein
MEDLLRLQFKSGQAVYTSKRYCLKGSGVTRQDVEKIAGELLANDIIQQWAVFDKGQWDPATGIGLILPKVILDHQPEVATLAIDSDETLARLSDERSLSLNPNDIPTIRSYFLKPEVLRQRQAEVGLSDPTDMELEYISQAAATIATTTPFAGVSYRDMETGEHRRPSTACSRPLSKARPWPCSRKTGWCRCCGTMPAWGVSMTTTTT